MLSLITQHQEGLDQEDYMGSRRHSHTASVLALSKSVPAFISAGISS